MYVGGSSRGIVSPGRHLQRNAVRNNAVEWPMTEFYFIPNYLRLRPEKKTKLSKKKKRNE
jgi:hypothetical protein